jgi:hypothetical protein
MAWTYGIGISEYHVVVNVFESKEQPKYQSLISTIDKPVAEYI